MRSIIGTGLTLFLDDGRVEVDTNTVERSMRRLRWAAATHCSAAAKAARELGDPGIAGQHGKAPRTRSAGLFDRRAGADRFRANQKPSTARTPGLN